MNINQILEKTNNHILPSKEEITYLLNAQDNELELLYNTANQLRQKIFGDEVFLRGIIEISNYCTKKCQYCGINTENTNTKRYRINNDEILSICKQLNESQITTIVLQAGEDPTYTKESIGELVSLIKSETNLVIALSLGEHPIETLEYWKNLGMNRYFIRFETSNETLFKNMHPDSDFQTRLKTIKNLQKLNIQTGSGFLIGIPQETIENLAEDILFCTNLNLNMIGVGPFVPHHQTNLKNETNPFDPSIFFKTIAILRLLNPKTHIPATTAFATIEKNSRDLVLQRGANIYMPNFTPTEYAKHYKLYDKKPISEKNTQDKIQDTLDYIKNVGRKVGNGPGHSIL